MKEDKDNEEDDDNEEDEATDLELGDDSSLGDGDRLLLHRLVDRRPGEDLKDLFKKIPGICFKNYPRICLPVGVVHLVELVDEADSLVGKDQRARLGEGGGE